MSLADFSSLVEVEWLARHLDHAEVRVLDGSWHLPTSGRDAAVEFEQGHIPQAAFFDIDRIADPATDLPHMLPTEDEFARAAGSLGIDNDTHVVVYDSRGLFSAARVWWMFRVFGHDRVAILDGGLPAWIAAGQRLESGSVTPRPRRFRARLDRARVWRLEDVRRNIDTGEALVIDARPAERFAGQSPEPRPGLRRGHVPGSINIPFDALTDPATGRLRDREALAELLPADADRPLVCSCGSGITAAAIAFGLHRLGREDAAIYDGSWSEWGARDDTPVAGDP